jgi:uncharacterized protein YciI
MAYFVVTRKPGPGWDCSRPMREQDGWDAHARFMDALAAEGFVVLGGPVGDRRRFLLIIDAEDETTIEARLAEDPWTPTEQLRIAKIDPWQVLLERRTDGMEA